MLVRAGSFIPMFDTVKTTRDYSSEKLTIHYYADESISESSGYMYEDDGESFDSIESKIFEILNFSAAQTNGILALEFSREGMGYQGMPAQRTIDLIVHNWLSKPSAVTWSGKNHIGNSPVSYIYHADTKQLTVSFSWNHELNYLSIH